VTTDDRGRLDWRALRHLCNDPTLLAPRSKCYAPSKVFAHVRRGDVIVT